MKTTWIGLGILLISLGLIGCKEQEPEHASACRYADDKFEKLFAMKLGDAEAEKIYKDVANVAKDAGLYDLQKCPQCVMSDYAYENNYDNVNKPKPNGFYEHCLNSYVLKDKGA